jgi:hypothetical protein
VSVRSPENDATPEIGQLGHARAGQHDVVRFDVAMNHAAGMRIRESAERMSDVAESIGGPHSHRSQRCGKAHAIHEFHYQRDAVLHAQRGSHGHDVRMIETGQNPDFAQESLGKTFSAFQTGQDDLHRLHAVGEQIAHAEHLAHATLAEHRLDAVIADNIAHPK